MTEEEQLEILKFKLHKLEKQFDRIVNDESGEITNQILSLLRGRKITGQDYYKILDMLKMCCIDRVDNGKAIAMEPYKGIRLSQHEVDKYMEKFSNHFGGIEHEKIEFIQEGEMNV